MKLLLKRRLANDFEERPSKRTKFDTTLSSFTNKDHNSNQQRLQQKNQALELEQIEEQVLSILKKVSNGGEPHVGSDGCSCEQMDLYEQVLTAVGYSRGEPIGRNGIKLIIEELISSISLEQERIDHCLNKRLEVVSTMDEDVMYDQMDTLETTNTTVTEPVHQEVLQHVTPQSQTMETWQEKEKVVIEHYRIRNYNFGLSEYARHRIIEEGLHKDYARMFRMIMNPADPVSLKSWISVFTPEKSGFIHSCTLREFYHSLEMNIDWAFLEMQIKDMFGIFNLENMPTSLVRKSSLSGYVFKMLSIPEYMKSFNQCAGLQAVNYHEWICDQFATIRSTQAIN